MYSHLISCCLFSLYFATKNNDNHYIAFIFGGEAEGEKNLISRQCFGGLARARWDEEEKGLLRGRKVSLRQLEDVLTSRLTTSSLRKYLSDYVTVSIRLSTNPGDFASYLHYHLVLFPFRHNNLFHALEIPLWVNNFYCHFEEGVGAY